MWGGLDYPEQPIEFKRHDTVYFAGSSVAHVALGADFTLAVCGNGGVYLWGTLTPAVRSTPHHTLPSFLLRGLASHMTATRPSQSVEIVRPNRIVGPLWSRACNQVHTQTIRVLL